MGNVVCVKCGMKAHAKCPKCRTVFPELGQEVKECDHEWEYSGAGRCIYGCGHKSPSFDTLSYLISKTCDLDAVIKAITSRGDGKTIKTSKPKDGVMVYIWRMCRFHSGIDSRMPMTCTWDLGNQILKDTGATFRFIIYSSVEKEITRYLDTVVDKVLDKMGKSKFRGALAWKGLLY